MIDSSCIDGLAPTGGGAWMVLVVVGFAFVVLGITVLWTYRRVTTRKVGTSVALVLLLIGGSALFPALTVQPAHAESCSTETGAPMSTSTVDPTSTPTATSTPTPTSTATPTPTPTPTPVPFVCPSGILPAVANGGAISTSVVVLGNHGAMLLGPVFAIDTSAVDPAVYGTTYTVSQTSGVLLMSTGSPYTSIGLASGSGTVGGVSQAPGNPNWSNLMLPNGLYNSGSNPTRPLRVTSTFVLGFTSPTTNETINCEQTLAWTTGGFFDGRVLFGAANLQYTGTLIPAP